jgi:hypothetical protein
VRAGLPNNPRHQKVSSSELSSNRHSLERRHIGTLGSHHLGRFLRHEFPSNRLRTNTLDNSSSPREGTSKHTVNDIDYQLVPHHCHRRNAAERAIRTFKENFVAGISSFDPAFPLHLWDRLLQRAEITLNLLRTLRLHPQLSAASHFHGLVDYNKTTFAPPGYKILAHAKSGKRRTWAPHGQHGYSLGTAMHHYRYQNVYISATASERIVDTLEFFPHNYQIPQLSSTYRLLVAAKDMTDALQNPHPEVPLARVWDDTILALAELAAILKLKLRQTPASNGHPKNQILNSPIPLSRQMRSQTTIHTQYIPNTPLPSRVVTPRTLRPSPPRVTTRSHILSPRNLSQDDFCGMDIARMSISLGDNHWS